MEAAGNDPGGASGYVLKQLGDDGGFVTSVRSAADGRRMLPDDVRARVAKSLYATAGAPWLKAMTERERTVLAFMAQGLTNRQLGQELELPREVVVACVPPCSRSWGSGGGAGWHRLDSPSDECSPSTDLTRINPGSWSPKPMATVTAVGRPPQYQRHRPTAAAPNVRGSPSSVAAASTAATGLGPYAGTSLVGPPAARAARDHQRSIR